MKKLALLNRILSSGVTTPTGANLTIVHELPPEEVAMIQALNSRSAGGIRVNIQKILEEDTEEWMKKFYIGYGHKSIADCGSTAVFLDGISMLAAKTFQDWQLYNGQETSTRFIDVRGLGVIDPVGTTESASITNEWFKFYNEVFADVVDHLKIKHPIKKSELGKEEKYNQAIEKRAFDVLRSFLPAGAKTNASVFMTLRQFGDQLALLRHHPLSEVQDNAIAVFNALQEKYPGSFSHGPRNDSPSEKQVFLDREAFRKEFMSEHYLWKVPAEKWEDGQYKAYINFLRQGELLEEFGWAVKGRPVRTEMPKIVNEYGSFELNFLIDFGSYRDLQRQRSALQRMPLLTTEFGFAEWYLDQLPDRVREKAEKLIVRQTERISKLECADEERQYYMAMGYQVPNRFTISLADMIYVTELRCGKTVHPTARAIALKMHETLTSYLPGVTLHAYIGDDDFDIRRADQTIKKEA